MAVAPASSSDGRCRRQFSWHALQPLSFGSDQIASRNEQDTLRKAARLWAQQQHEVVGTLSTPRLLPGRCHKHNHCFYVTGKTFRFIGSWDADRSAYSLQVGVDGICDEASPRAAREARRYKEDEISVEDRLSIVRQAEYLLSTGRKATSSSVAMRLQNKEVPASKIKYILRHGRRT